MVESKDTSTHLVASASVVVGTRTRSMSRLMTACVPARLPELSSTSTRSPTRSKTVILQNVATSSKPALVRESDASTIPSRISMPTQYVTPRALPSTP